MGGRGLGTTERHARAYLGRATIRSARLMHPYCRDGEHRVGAVTQAVHDFVKVTLKSSSMKSTNPSIRSRYEVIHNEITWSDFSLKSAADNSIGRH